MDYLGKRIEEEFKHLVLDLNVDFNPAGMNYTITGFVCKGYANIEVIYVIEREQFDNLSVDESYEVIISHVKILKGLYGSPEPFSDSNVHECFKSIFEGFSTSYVRNHYTLDSKEELEQSLKDHEEAEDYEKCAEIKKQIDKLKE